MTPCASNKFFHVLGGVSMVRGSVITPESARTTKRGMPAALTGHAVCIITKPMENSRINAVSLFDEDSMVSSRGCSLVRGPQIQFVNKPRGSDTL